jgi:DNA-binding response OmpR family regulator
MVHMRKKRIFLVEDDADLRGFLTCVLEDEFGVEGFSRGDDALLAVRREPPDVLVTDLALPGLAGERLAEEAGRIEPRPAVVLMSADSRRLRRACALGHAALLKPFLLSDLADVLRRLLPSRS